jgi:hypothetical protein
VGWGEEFNVKNALNLKKKQNKTKQKNLTIGWNPSIRCG